MATNVTGTVTRLSFAASDEVKALIEAKAASSSVMEYTDATTTEINDTRGAIAAYLNGSPEGVAEDWGLQAAIAAHAAGEAGAACDVVVFKTIETIETSSTTLNVGGESGTTASLTVPVAEGEVTVRFDASALADCRGRQNCLFGLRIYEPNINAAGRYDFRGRGDLTDTFLRDLRRSSR